MSLKVAMSRPTDVIAAAAHPLTDDHQDYDDLMGLIGDRRLVMIGEASHGTHEFYRERVRITQRLIEEKGFTAVAVEGDWPDAYRINRYALGITADPDAETALRGFGRFPSWMWRNREVLHFVQWMRERNDAQTAQERKARFYGLDLYSLRASISSVIGYLDAVDPAEAQRARARYSCFDHVGANGHAYGYSVAAQRSLPCENEVVEQLLELRRLAEHYLRSDGLAAEDAQFDAEQNAVVVRDAEEYYQQMYRATVSSWNLRDRHMAATLESLIGHLDRQFGHAKVVVWEHNSHIGDARATAMSHRGEFNIGQLVRQRHGSESFLIGFSTYDGSVTAATDWGNQPERMRVNPALDESHEALLHAVGLPNYWIGTHGQRVHDVLSVPRLERAIGVVYRPHTERMSHYFQANMADQFDAVVHIDRTSALEPLERTEKWDRGEPPETYPSGL